MKKYIIISLFTSICIEGSFSGSTSKSSTPDSKNAQSFFDSRRPSSSSLSLTPSPLIFTGQKKQRLPFFESIAPSQKIAPRRDAYIIPSETLKTIEDNKILYSRLPLNINEHAITADPNIIILNGNKYFINREELDKIYEIKGKIVIPLKGMIHYNQESIKQKYNLPHPSEWINIPYFESDKHFKTVHDDTKTNGSIIAQMQYKIRTKRNENSSPEALKIQNQKYETLLRQMNIIIPLN